MNEKYNINFKERKSLADLLKTSQISYSDLMSVSKFGITANASVGHLVASDIKYEGYVMKQEKEINKMKASYKIKIPKDIDYNLVKGLSNEATERLNKAKPDSIGQAANIPGINTSSLALIKIFMKKQNNCKMPTDVSSILNEVFHNLIEDKKHLLQTYLDLLFKWHKTSNIVSSSDKEYVIKREVYDSYKLTKFMRGQSYTDIGSGGGLPGIILAIFNPEKEVVLLDRKSSFIDFLELAKAELMLDNVNVVKQDFLVKDTQLMTDTVIFKNFSNKLISKMTYEEKFIYLMESTKKSKSVSKAYMLTGSPVIELSDSCISEYNIKVEKLVSPFFSSDRFIAEVNF